MVYEIRGHLREESEDPQQTALGETAQIYTVCELTKDRNEPPRHPDGTDLWKPPEADFDSQKLPYIPPDCVKLMLPSGPEIMRWDPTLPPEMQSLDFPGLFQDVMRIRWDVIVREYGGKLEDIASDLWDDSVSLHWVVYVTDYFDNEGIKPGSRRFPIGTIKVRPVIGMTNYIQVSDPIVIDWFRGVHWIENILINAVLQAFYGYLPPEFFHDIFGRVIPLDSDTLNNAQDPVRAAEVRLEWKDRIVGVVPDALQWSGVLFINADMRKWRWWFHGTPWEHLDGSPFGDDDRVFMEMTFQDSKESRPSREISLFKLSRAQRKVFNITHTMVGGTDSPSWQVRTFPHEALPVISYFTFTQNL